MRMLCAGSPAIAFWPVPFSKQAGDFIGQVDPQLAGSLIEGGFYRHQERFNLQAWCLRGASEPTQSASRLTAPLIALIKNIWGALSSIHFILQRYVYFYFYCWYHFHFL